MAPPGCQVVVHEKPSKRKSWSPPGIDGWYVGPAWDHYRCHEVYIPKTRAFRISDTIDFFPVNVALTPKTKQQQIEHLFKKLVKIYEGDPEKLTQSIRPAFKQLEKVIQTPAVSRKDPDPISDPDPSENKENIFKPKSIFPENCIQSHKYLLRSKTQKIAVQSPRVKVPRSSTSKGEKAACTTSKGAVSQSSC